MKRKQPVQKTMQKAVRRLKTASPTILSCVGAIGVVATTVLAVKATPKAVVLIQKDSRKRHDGDPYAGTKMEAVKACWKCYVPAAMTGTATIVCIFGANVLNRRQQASLASAYALVSRQYQDYKNKVVELYGKETHDRIMKSLAVEKAKDIDITAQGGFYSTSLDFEGAKEETQLFYDRVSERYFESTIGKVLQAEYHINRNLTLRGEVRLNEFYDFLGLEHISVGDEIGWFIDDDEIYWIDWNHIFSPIDDGPNSDIECWIIDPVFDPHKPLENW